jgi:hypothetical protein
MKQAEKPKRKYNYTKKTGAPTKYKPEYCQIAEDLTAQGYSMPVVGLDCGGVLVDTIVDWMKVHVDFCLAIKRGRAKRLKELEFMITCHAKGIKTRTFDPKQSNITAIIFELKTRFHEQWSDKQKIMEMLAKAGGKIQINIDSSDAKL